MNRITPADWVVTGHEIIAWINDLEFFDVVFYGDAQMFALRINHLATANSTLLGMTSSVAEAISRANAFIMDDGNGGQQSLTCAHNLTIAERCEDCANEV